MLQELKEKSYQNFYINDDKIICGIVSPKEIWKIFEPAELQAYYIEKVQYFKDKLKTCNFDLFKSSLDKYQKMLDKLTREMNKLCKEGLSNENISMG